jgi:hypothetical protein
MPNAVLTPTVIAREALMQLKNNLVMGNLVHRQYKKEFVKVGGSVNIRRPVKFAVSDGAILEKQDVEETNDTFVINKRKHVSWGFNTQDLTLAITDYSERYIRPAAMALANQVDADLMALYDDLWNWVGTPGEIINGFPDFAKGPQRLDEMSVPQNDRFAVLSPADKWGLIGSKTDLFDPVMVRSAFEMAKLGRVGGVDCFMGQNVVRHTVGVATGSPDVLGADQNTAYLTSGGTNSQSLITDGWTNDTAGILKAGDVFTIAGVKAVNEKSKATLSFDQQFVARNDVNSGASTGPATFTVSPAIITAGPYQTVSAVPADGADITVLGTGGTTYDQSMVFHKNTFGLVMVPLKVPQGVPFGTRLSSNGLSIRVIKSYDNITDEETIRLDVLYGVKTLYADLGTRLSGTGA